jgi:hypothetical protein
VSLFFAGDKLIFGMLMLLTLLVILWQVSLKLEGNLPLVVLIPAANLLLALFMSILFYSPLSDPALSLGLCLTGYKVTPVPDFI